MTSQGSALHSLLASQRPRNARRNRSLLNPNTRPVPVLRRRVRTTVGQTQLADVPVFRIGRRRRADGRHDLLQRIRAVGRPEADGPRVEVDVVRKVVPVVWHQLRRPLRDGLHVPAQRVIRGGLSAQRAVFYFGEVALSSMSMYSTIQFRRGVRGRLASKKAI